MSIYSSIWYLFFDRKGLDLMEINSVYQLRITCRTGCSEKRAFKQAKSFGKKFKKHLKPPKYMDEGVMKLASDKLRLHSGYEIVSDIIDDLKSQQNTGELWQVYTVYNYPIDLSEVIRKYDSLNVGVESKTSRIMRQYEYEFTKLFHGTDIFEKYEKESPIKMKMDEDNECSNCGSDAKFILHTGLCLRCGVHAIPLTSKEITKSKKAFGDFLTSATKARKAV